VPSSLTAEQFAESPGISTADMFDTAVVRFQTALSGLGAASDPASIRQINLAKVGLARALLNNAKYAEAAAAVAGVPDNFVYFDDHSANTNREINSVWALQDNGRWTVPEVEGINGINWQSANDPRVPWIDAGVNGFDKANRLFKQVKWAGRDNDVPLATGAEARLIEGEAALQANDAATWLAKLNGLRAQVRALMTAYTNPQTFTANNPNTFVTNTTLAPLVDPGTQAARVDLTFRERAFWFYLTGHRLGDLRRLIRQYQRGAETVFPTGTWHKGGPYGTDVALLDSFQETNNSLFDPAGCKANVP
jgi:starch-binding outer membrane protein, SusD/RagB family